MADFELAFASRWVYPIAAGRPAYRGISRRFHPSWPRWNVNDMAIGNGIDPDSEQIYQGLDPHVHIFYRSN
jgi:hypothetical protein